MLSAPQSELAGPVATVPLAGRGRWIGLRPAHGGIDLAMCAGNAAEMP